ncbi:hypothetical protein [Streptomyces sp. cg36]|uniref:hypothetical protein n=1 Tax=Streptomyces sp. cg36 TaxID=3238798 RepID=UPI0034E24A2F
MKAEGDELRSWSEPTKYLYWAEHRIDLYLKSNSQHTANRTHQLAMPSVQGILPAYTQTWTPSETWARTARRLTRRLASHTHEIGTAPQGVRFVKGHTPLVLGQLCINHERTAGGLFYAQQGSTVVLLFASLRHLSPDVTSRGVGDDAHNPYGWFSSRAHDVYCWLAGITGGPDGPRYRFRDDHHFAEECLKIALHQGDSGSPRRASTPWLQPFRFGHIERGCSWLAEIHWDVRVREPQWEWHEMWPNGRRYGGIRVDRILIGAPFWLRTAPDAPMLHYGDYTLEERRQWNLPTPPPDPVRTSPRPSWRDELGDR